MTHDRQRVVEKAIAAGLSPRQALALMWQSEGCTVVEAAMRMGVRPGTVKTLLAQARLRFGATSTIELLAVVAFREAA